MELRGTYLDDVVVRASAVHDLVCLDPVPCQAFGPTEIGHLLGDDFHGNGNAAKNRTAATPEEVGFSIGA